MRDQLLRNDSLENERELSADLSLLACREGVDYPVYRFEGRVGMKSRESEMARLRDSQGGRHSLKVAHLTDKDDIGVLPEDMLECGSEIVRIGLDFPLVYDAVLVRVDILDRILDRDHMSVTLLVDLVDQAGESRRFTGTGRAGHQDESLLFLGECADHRWQAEFLEIKDLEGDLPDSEAGNASLLEHVGTES